ncbi:MAG TPA: alanine--glyoxylate aminotransferase family protein [Anaerolineales bacterium]|nr:alanine--glyoxylate aminotransferase family protein [Anaerolineales bacterium]
MENDRYSDLDLSPRVLLGPGPSMVSPRVLRSLATPLVGHLDPEFLKLMEEVQQLLRYVFRTKNELTVPISGTGSAGMEAALCNFIEPGDRVLIAIQGYFGERLFDIAGRYGAVVDRIEKPWGQVFDPQEIKTALSQAKYKLVAIVHAETSTGARQPGIPEIAAAAHQYGALLVLDTVTSLGGLPVEIDAWEVDIAYSGTQKNISAPPGLAPLTVSPRACDVLRSRKMQVQNWYLDLSMLEKYWGKERTYHHTAPISMNYALREALRMVAEEGLEARFARHRANAELLWAGLEEMDLSLLVPLENRLPTLSTPLVPPGVDETDVRRRLLNDYNIEVAGGFGQLKGKVWRIGLMGFSSRRENVALLLAAIRQILSNHA